MKTLYESILDSDAQDKIEHRVSAHANRKKLLVDILNKLYDIVTVLDFRYETSTTSVDSRHYLGLTENVVYYVLGAKYDPSKKGDLFGKIVQSMKKIFTDYKYECNYVPGNDMMGDKYIFAPIGITLCIAESGKKNKTVALAIYINKGDQDAMNQVNKFVEKFTTK